MAKYSSYGKGRDRGGRGGSRYGGRSGGRGSSRGGGRSSRGGSSRGGKYDDDEYYDEEPAYGKGAKAGSHEQAGVLIFGGAIVIVIITIIFLAAGGGQKTVKRAMRLQKGGYYELDAREMAASDLLGKARYFDQANPYEDKEIVAAKYSEVSSRYPGTQAAGEASQYYTKVMDRRR